MKKSAAATILRWGLAFVFFYAGVAALRDPAAWAGFLPAFLSSSSAAHLFLTGFSVYEIILALWLFVGRKLSWSSMLAFITLGVITIFNFSLFSITFRDVGLAMAALALFEMARGGKSVAEAEVELAKEEELL